MFDLRSLWKNKWWAYITIEPSYALFWFAEYQCNFYQENIILQKACRINATSEPDLNTPCDDEKQGIAFVAFVNSWIHLLTSILLTLLCAAFIKWSDRAGNQRKFILVWPTIGLNVMVLSSCLHTYFWSWNPLYYVICYEICQLVTGGPILYYFAAILYISDISSPRSRTARLGVLATMQYVCLPVGNVFSGFVLKRLGFLRSNLLSFVFTSVSLLLCVTLVKDISKPAEKKKGSFWKSLAAFNVTSAVNVMLKRRRNNKRFVLNLLLFTKVFVLFSRAGEKSVLYLYMRHRFQWDERQYSFFDAYKNTGIIAGVLISMFVFSKCLKMHDIKIALFAGVCDTIAATCYIFANQNWHFFVICLIDMFHGAAFITAKSYTTKIVDSSELGNLTSVSALLSFISFLNKPLYNMVFKMNMDTFPNCFFLISVVVCMLSTISFGICYKFIKNYETIEAKEAVNESPDGGIKLDYRAD